MTKTILILAANPKKTSQLRLSQEVRHIDEGLRRSQQRDQFILKQQWAVRLGDILRAMLDSKPQIVHFSGRGAGEEGLVFEDELGQPKLITGAALASLFKLFASTLECVVLNGCYSQVQAEAIAQHIPSVIGMSQAIRDRVAIEFAVGFYNALSAGETVKFAYELGSAAIQTAGVSGELTPVLLKRPAAKTTITWNFVLAGTLSDVDQGKLKAIVDYLRKLSGDASLNLSKVKRGSIVLVLEGSEEGFRIIESLFKSGQLTQVLGLSVKFVEHELPTPKLQFSTIPAPIELFISYSHKDENLKDELVTHLSILRRQKIISAWHDREISAGAEWANAIDEHMESASVILLLISANFLNSDYCYDIELERAMERHEAGEARVIPIILKPVDWGGAMFGKLQALPKNAKPITTWENKDEAFLNIAQGLRRVVEEFKHYS